MALIRKLLFSICLLFTLANTATATDNEFTIQSGDILQITVWKEEGLDREILILPDGTLTFPLIGQVSAEGLTIKSLKTIIKTKIDKYIPDAAVTVMVKAPLGHTVNLIGQVARPGEIIMQGDLSALQALSQAGGLTQYADSDDIVILRGKGKNKKSINFPYDDIARGKKLNQDISLRPGDIIVVPTSGLF